MFVALKQILSLLTTYRDDLRGASHPIYRTHMENRFTVSVGDVKSLFNNNSIQKHNILYNQGGCMSGLTELREIDER